MKTQFSHTKNKIMSTVAVLILMIAVVGVQPLYGQTDKTSNQDERTITGVISTEDGPLESANVILKGTQIGTVTNSKGEFTFPKLLKTGDILLISYLGFETQSVKIKADTSVIKLVLSEDLLEFVGALDSNTPYKSKRSK